MGSPNRECRRCKQWKQPKIATYSKGVQVYEDVLKQKYNWKTEKTSRMVQTEDIVLERLALEQNEFRKSLPYQRYFKYTKHSV